MQTTTPTDDSEDSKATDADAEFTAAAEMKKENSIWWRLLFMIILACLYGVSRVVIGAVVVLQFLWVAFANRKNPKLSELGQSLATYTYQIIGYLTFNTDERPFPFELEWPKGKPS